ncbi:hypothetical protein PoB_002798000 [Plakobranchus ocellatus]|uniref:Uncharacterized protein n=1 Tax=Plakobranchus ocellatus TaxID=259542 RepID=A0AAV4A243_9GAST|nr:hypothetical protein PoB_002798000 [Plakobranchus ocellatus]
MVYKCCRPTPAAHVKTSLPKPGCKTTKTTSRTHHSSSCNTKVISAGLLISDMKPNIFTMIQFLRYLIKTKPNLDSMFNDMWQDHVKSINAKDVKVSDSPRCVTFIHPGLPFWSFELDPRVPGLISMLRVCEDSLFFGVSQPISDKKDETFLLILKLMEEDYIPFHNAHEYTMTREMYDPDIPKWPLKVKLGYTGRHGPLVNLQLHFYSAENDTLLMTRTQNITFVNIKTRRLDDLPQWFAKALDGKETAQKNVQIERMIKPDRTFTHKATILFTDTDTFQHANYLTYVRFCQRAIRQAVTENMRAKQQSGGASLRKSGCPVKITADVLKKGVKSAKIRYFKECTIGDEVVVHVWEEDDKPFWVFFSVESETSNANILRCQMSLEYFSK